MILGVCAGCGSSPAQAGYIVNNLVSDLSGVAPVTDPDLVNPWGLASSSGARSGRPTMVPASLSCIKGAANRFPLVVTIPAPTHGSPPTAPTGVAVRAQTADPPVHFAECAEDQCRSGDAPLAQPADDLEAVEAWQ